MKIKFNLDSQLIEEKVEFWLKKMNPKIERIAKELTNDQDVLWCYQNQKIMPVDFDQICVIQVIDEKTQIMAQKQQYVYKGRLYQVKQVLPDCFLAASRSAIVNYKQIDHLELLDNGNIDAIMKNEMRVQFSRRKIKGLKEKLGL